MATGNELNEYAAQLFEASLDIRGFPIAESSAASGPYPKQWDLPCWQRILAREDVEWAELRMWFWTGPHEHALPLLRHGILVSFSASLVSCVPRLLWQSQNPPQRSLEHGHDSSDKAVTKPGA